jgi:hypothetical protein
MTKEQLAKLITEVLGERCPEHHDTCMTCAAWWMFDRISVEPGDDRDPACSTCGGGTVLVCITCNYAVSSCVCHLPVPQVNRGDEHG